jgi:broad specificity phosphatase PhoE
VPLVTPSRSGRIERVGVVILIRHGETDWSASGRHTSITDVPLTGRGEAQAVALQRRLNGRDFVAVLSSPRRRALLTAQLAGLAVTAVDEELAEWAYGGYEGRTTHDIREERPDWSLWTDGGPGGESPAHVGDRADRVLARITPLLAEGDVALVGHGHFLRVLGARWIGLTAAGGAALAFAAAGISELGHEHGIPVLAHWNLTDDSV